MAEADDILRDALEANKAKELLFRREAEAIASGAAALAGALGAGRTLYVVGQAELGHAARLVAHAFFAPETGDPLRAIALGASAAAGEGSATLVREVKAFLEAGDVLLAIGLDGAPSVLAPALDAARSKGAATLALTGYPGEGLAQHADVVIVVPSRRWPVVTEGVLSVGLVLARLVARRLGPGEVAARDPFESTSKGRSPDAPLDPENTSSEAVVAELVRPNRKRGSSSSVELVPLYAEAPEDGAPPPPDRVRFKCANCGETITVDARFAGRAGQCPSCLADFVIPRSDQVGVARPVPPSAADRAVGSSSAARRDPGAAGRSPTASGAAPASASSSGARRDPSASGKRSAGPTPRPAGLDASGGRPKPSPGNPRGTGPSGEPVERRRAGRVNVQDAVVCYGREAFPDDEGQPSPRHGLADLSLTGLSLTTRAAEGEALDVKVGDKVFLLLDFPAFVDKIRVQGDVRRVEPLPDRSGWAVGVRFSRFLDDAQAKVRRLVENAALRGVRRR